MGKQKTDLSRFCGVKIRTLPDFLMDHTLLQPEFAQRLPEHCERWIQFVSRLWAWHGKAVFCLRFDGRPREGAIGIYFLAKTDESNRDELQRDIEFSLAAYGIVNDIDDPGLCLPLLSDAEIEKFAKNPEEVKSEINREFQRVLSPELNDLNAFALVSQNLATDLWVDRGAVGKMVKDERLKFSDRDKEEAEAWIPQLWDGPTGSFLLPLKALMASDEPIQLSIYLEPCTPSKPERVWLNQIALYAQKSAKDEAFEDPAAQMAVQRTTSATRRLLGDTFMVSVVVAARNDLTGVKSLANSVRALCLQKSGKEATPEEDWPADAHITVAVGKQIAEARNSHFDLTFPNWADLSNMPASIRRLPYLTDARGAATVFRLPVSVRGGVPGVEVQQPAPDFNPGPRGDQKELRRAPRAFRRLDPRPSIVIGKFESAGYARVEVDDLAKHTLVTGFTGSGKTMTVMHLLHQLWVDHKKPFLVIETAKTEYRGLTQVSAFRASGSTPQLLVYTLGNQAVAPFRLNPFELLEGVRVEAHVNRLKTCFEAAMPPFAPLGSIIEQSLIEVYRDLGWTMTDRGIARRELENKAVYPGRRYPRMIDFAKKLEAIGESRGYRGENRATLLAAIRGRIFPLTRSMHGSKGMMLDADLSEPNPARLFETPTILELNDLDYQDKALVSMFILTLLREYREQEQQKPDPGRAGLKHVTVVEEAHNVLQNISSVGSQEGAESDVRHKAVQSFCAMLAEIRALGEGLIISDQSPEKLAPDALRNTNIQISHQLRDARDRQAIAAAMIMSDEQRDFLGKLKPGFAGIFYTGMQRASYVKVPRFDKPGEEFGGAGIGYDPMLSDAVVKAQMYELTKTLLDGDRPFDGCKRCDDVQKCSFKWRSRELRERQEIKSSFEAAFNAAPNTKVTVVAAILANAAPPPNEPGAARAAMWCHLLHLRHAAQVNGGIKMDDEELHQFFVRELMPAITEAADA